MPLIGGQGFAGYKVVRLLGSGGMGEVYLAEHPRLPRPDALKILPADVSADADYRARFNREADLASKLWHPNIVSVHDRGEFHDQLWIAMDYVHGLDAARLLARQFSGGMPPAHVVRIVTAVASALDYAHKQGLLHRDVKPANIMLTHLDDEDEEQRVLLTDFGIARRVDDISGLTATNMTVGTVAYCAPEQLLGEEIDGRADQYALAATAFHLLSGQQMFSHTNPAVVISRHLSYSPPSLTEVHPDLGAADSALARALVKDPAERFARCSDFARALAEAWSASDVAVSAAPTQLSPRPQAFTAARLSEPDASLTPPRRRWWLISAAAPAAVLVAAAATFVWHPWVGQHGAQPSTEPMAPAVSAPAPAAQAPAEQPPPPQPAGFPAKAIDSVLLTDDEVNSILETYAISGSQRTGVMKVDRSTYGMSDNSVLVTPSSCVGVVFGAEHTVYADSGYEAMRDQTFVPRPYVYDPTVSAPNSLEQAAIVFPSAARAQAVLTSAQDQWKTCADGEIDQKAGPESSDGWKLSNVQREGDVLSVKMSSNGAEIGAAACQQVLAVRDNVVVTVRGCNGVEPSAQTNYDSATGWPSDPRWAHNDASRLAAAMIEKVKS
jgi:serine/threonine protein kinase